MLDLNAVESVIGMPLKSFMGEDMGHVVDILVTPRGDVRAAVIDFGGMLGVGSRKVAVDWTTLKFGGEGKDAQAVLALTRNQVRVAPEYKVGDPVVVLELPKMEPARMEPAKAEPNKMEPAKAGSKSEEPKPAPKSEPKAAPRAGDAPAGDTRK